MIRCPFDWYDVQMGLALMLVIVVGVMAVKASIWLMTPPRK